VVPPIDADALTSENAGDATEGAGRIGNEADEIAEAHQASVWRSAVAETRSNGHVCVTVMRYW
jgi:hypothetical protein